MCGIVGKLYFDRKRPVSRRELTDMADTLEHRGPDAGSVWHDGNVGLAHRRLAIIDLHETANQPMSNETGDVWLTFNGEIYNFKELRMELEACGHNFRTQSDTEVIVHAYEEYGQGCLARLRGMFAFAIWDARADLLFVARDRVGKKPLYYHLGRDRFLFASEIKALLKEGSVSREVDPSAIDQFLARQYIPAPLSAFKAIRKLEAAHWLQVHNGQLESGRYWKLRYSPKRPLSMRDACRELRWHLSEAVRLRLTSDVPLGAFLSGGVDSSAIVATMTELMDRPVRTFTMGFEDATFDERRFARIVAERCGAVHTEFVLNLDVADLLPRLVWHFDEPFGDSSAVPSYAIAELTREQVGVVLNGDGADESFAGYDWYKMDRLIHRGAFVPLRIRQHLGNWAQQMPTRWRRSRLLRQLARLGEVVSFPDGRRYSQWTEHFGPGVRAALYADPFRRSLNGYNADALYDSRFHDDRGDEWLDQLLSIDVDLYLADDLLVKMDRATMAHSLEARSPFLDHVLMEFAAKLPSAFKLAWGQKKRVLRQSLRGLIPDSLLDRKKMGFSVPIAQWLREDLRAMSLDLLLSKRSLERGYFRPKAITELIKSHDSGDQDHGERLWDLLILELWHRAFVDVGAGA